jgi:hypothetical protein
MKIFRVFLIASLLGSVSLVPLNAAECRYTVAADAEAKLKVMAERVRVEHDATEPLLKRAKARVKDGAVPDADLMEEIKAEELRLWRVIYDVEHFQDDCTMLLENNMDPILRFSSKAMLSSLRELIEKYAPDKDSDEQ